MKKTCAFLLTILIGASGFAQDNAGFITLLGNDTMVAENFIFSDHDVEAWIVIRTPVTLV